MKVYSTPRRVSKHMEGLRFGRLTVTGMLGAYDGEVYWKCLCDCGNTVEVPTGRLNIGNTTSCGCRLSDMLKERNSTHGMSKHPLYGMWQRMWQRCTDEGCGDYKYYGGRGITVCDRWKNFEDFLLDVGERPHKYTLDRIDNNGPYSSNNCRWASRKEQTNNRDITKTLSFNGETKSLAEWSEVTGIKYRTIKARVSVLGYSAKDVLTKEVKCGGRLPGKEYKKRRKPNTENIKKGFDSPRARLSRDQVRIIQHLHRECGWTYTALSKKYGVSIETASRAAQAEGYFNLEA